jgi:hypothetical protein
MKKIFIFLAIIFITSCGYRHLKIAEQTTEIGRAHGFEQKTYQTKNFKVFTLQKISDPKKPLRIYFEGDGKAYIARNIPSPNPTPVSNFLIDLIIEDEAPNLVYIARPCQYVTDKKCQEKYWTNARFSEEILAAVDEVVKNFPTFKLELVGYSGGAEVAKYVAAKNKNTLNLRTIAGNLDHKKFNEINHAKDLDEYFDSDKILPQLEKIPQIHFVGVNDQIVPSAVAESYLEKMLNKSCVKILEVRGATHYDGWKKTWKEMLEIKPEC